MTRLAPPLECQRLEPRDVPAIVGGFGAADLATRLFATGAPIGSDGVVTVFDSQSNFVGTIRPFGGTNLGVAVDVGDVNGDGVYDIVCGLGAGGRPRVEIYSGRGLGLIAQYDAFDPNFRGGVNVAVGNLDGDNRSEVIVGSGLGSFPIVRELEGLSGVERRAFFAFDLAFLGGVSVAVGAVNADTTPDIIAGAGPGGLPVVATFDSLTTQQLSARFAFDTAFRGGVLVAAGDVDGDRLTETIVGAGPGGVPVVRIFKGQALADTASFFAAPSTFTGGIAPLVFDISGSGVGTIYTAIGAGSNVVPANSTAGGFGTFGTAVSFGTAPTVNGQQTTPFLRAYQAVFRPVSEVGNRFAATRQVNFGTLPASPVKINALLNNDFATLFS